MFCFCCYGDVEGGEFDFVFSLLCFLPSFLPSNMPATPPLAPRPLALLTLVCAYGGLCLSKPPTPIDGGERGTKQLGRKGFQSSRPSDRDDGPGQVRTCTAFSLLFYCIDDALLRCRSRSPRKCNFLCSLNRSLPVETKMLSLHRLQLRRTGDTVAAAVQQHEYKCTKKINTVLLVLFKPWLGSSRPCSLLAYPSCGLHIHAPALHCTCCTVMLCAAVCCIFAVA